MNTPGRNDPCHCGSGRKYKHCCLATDQRAQQSPDDVIWRRVRRANEGFPRLMARFVADVYGAAAVDEAWSEFTLWNEDEFDAESPLGAIFLPWFYHRWVPDPLEDTCIDDAALHLRTPTSQLLEQRGAGLDPLLRRYLAACLEAPFGFHEILEVQAGRGFRTREVITGEEHAVLERSASQTMEPGDIVYGQLVPIDGIVMLEACSPYVIPPADKLSLIELREFIQSGRPGEPLHPEILDEFDMELRELYLTLIGRILDPQAPVLTNTDGELVVPQRVVFDIDSADDAWLVLQHLAGDDAEALAAAAAAERRADGALARLEFSWVRAGNAMHANWNNTVLGRIEIEAGRLTGEVNSVERGQRFRGLVEAALGAGARLRSLETVAPSAEVAEEGGPSGHEPGEAAAIEDSPEVQAHLSRFLAAHYEDWLTAEIPALGHRRPIDAVADPVGREQVHALLRQMERDSRRMRPAPDAALFQGLRRKLGLGEGP
jgi:hypothetical protein